MNWCQNWILKGPLFVSFLPMYIVLHLRLDWYCRFILSIALQINDKRFKMCIYLCISLIVLGWSFAVDSWRSNCSRLVHTSPHTICREGAKHEMSPLSCVPEFVPWASYAPSEKKKNARSSRSTFSLTRRRYLHENCHAWLKHIRDSRAWYDG